MSRILALILILVSCNLSAQRILTGKPLVITEAYLRGLAPEQPTAVRIEGSVEILSDLTIHENVHLVFAPISARLVRAPFVTVTILGKVYAGDDPIFAGNQVVYLANQKEVNLAWWNVNGDGKFRESDLNVITPSTGEGALGFRRMMIGITDSTTIHCPCGDYTMPDGTEQERKDLAGANNGTWFPMTATMTLNFTKQQGSNPQEKFIRSGLKFKAPTENCARFRPPQGSHLGGVDGGGTRREGWIDHPDSVIMVQEVIDEGSMYLRLKQLSDTTRLKDIMVLTNGASGATGQEIHQLNAFRYVDYDTFSVDSLAAHRVLFRDEWVKDMSYPTSFAAGVVTTAPFTQPAEGDTVQLRLQIYFANDIDSKTGIPKIGFGEEINAGFGLMKPIVLNNDLYLISYVGDDNLFALYNYPGKLNKPAGTVIPTGALGGKNRYLVGLSQIPRDNEFINITFIGEVDVVTPTATFDQKYTNCRFYHSPVSDLPYSENGLLLNSDGCYNVTFDNCVFEGLGFIGRTQIARSTTNMYFYDCEFNNNKVGIIENATAIEFYDTKGYFNGWLPGVSKLENIYPWEVGRTSAEVVFDGMDFTATDCAAIINSGGLQTFRSTPGGTFTLRNARLRGNRVTTGLSLNSNNASIENVLMTGRVEKIISTNDVFPLDTIAISGKKFGDDDIYADAGGTTFRNFRFRGYYNNIILKSPRWMEGDIHVVREGSYDPANVGAGYSTGHVIGNLGNSNRATERTVNVNLDITVEGAMYNYNGASPNKFVGVMGPSDYINITYVRARDFNGGTTWNGTRLFAGKVCFPVPCD